MSGDVGGAGKRSDWLAGNAAYGNFTITSPNTIPWLVGRVILIHGRYRDRAAIAIAPMN